MTGQQLIDEALAEIQLRLDIIALNNIEQELIDWDLDHLDINFLED